MAALPRMHDAGATSRRVLAGKRIASLCLLVLLLCPHFAAADLPPIKIAAIFSLTGIAASHNDQMVKMTELAIEELNNRGGILNRPVELVLLDNRSTPIGSALAARWAVALDVVAVLGSVWSSHSKAMAPILQDAGVPMISPASTNPHVTRDRNYVFRVCFIDSSQGDVMARFARLELDVRTAAVVSNLDEEYSIELAKYFKKSFVEAGGEVRLDEQYRGDATDFSSILEKIQAEQPEVVYLPGYVRDSSLFIRQARMMGMDTVFLGGDAWDDIAGLAGDALDGSYHTAAWHPRVENVQSNHLKELYFRKFGEQINSFNSPLAYDAVMILAEAIKRCRCTRREEVRDALASIEAFPGATGCITFDENGDPRNKRILIVGFRAKEPVLVETTVP